MLTRAQAEAELVEKLPWFQDAVVDMHTVADRAFIEGGLLADEILIIPNPYFVLTLEGLVKWGFATPEEIVDAARTATSTNPPDRWRNPPLMKRLHFMGWSEAESRTRLGLFFTKMVPGDEAGQ